MANKQIFIRYQKKNKKNTKLPTKTIFYTVEIEVVLNLNLISYH